RQFGVTVHECVEALVQYSLRGGRGYGYVDDRLQLGLVHDLECTPRDIDAIVADPLDVAHDLHRGRNEAKIRCHRLFARENFQTEFVNLDLELIDLIVPIGYALRQRWASLHERPGRIGDG